MPRSESKSDYDASQEEKDCKGEARAVPVVSLLSLDVSPNHCGVSEPLELNMEFDLSAPLWNGRWDIKFLVDSVNARHLIKLGSTAAEDYPSGASQMFFNADTIDVSGIQACTLANAGLLTATLIGCTERDSAEVEVIDVNMVVQVEEKRGQVTRCIYSPLE